jgi:hypothetical protein
LTVEAVETSPTPRTRLRRVRLVTGVLLDLAIDLGDTEQTTEHTAMLAEIFLLRLEAAVRAAKETAATGSRFVPVTLPAMKAA